MTKNQVAWLIIRLTGIWLLWKAIEGTTTLISSFLFLAQSGQLNSHSVGVFWQIGLGIAVHLALAMFCLSSAANVLFNVIIREDGDSGEGPASILK
jgi:hypothetical protein